MEKLLFKFYLLQLGSLYFAASKKEKNISSISKNVTVIDKTTQEMTSNQLTRTQH